MADLPQDKIVGKKSPRLILIAVLAGIFGLVLLAIIGLVVVQAMTYSDTIADARLNRAQLDAAAVREAANSAWAHTGRCPTIVQELVNYGAIEEGTMDPWGGSFVIECADDHVLITSAGPDRAFGTEDDVTAP